MTRAMASITPTILTSKASTGTVPSTRLGNVAWSDDGQCLVLSKKEVVIMASLVLLHSSVVPVKLIPADTAPCIVVACAAFPRGS